jgi:chaperonin cofactor prefoldin
MRAWIMLIAGLFVLSNANAQVNQDPNDPGLSVTVNPATIPVNGTVTIAGIGYPQPGLQLVVTIVSPADVTTTYNLVPNSEGRYQTVFSKTPVEGDYKITVQPGGKGAGAKATFSAHSYLIDIDEDVANNKDLLDESAGVVKKAKKSLDTIPDSPAKTQLEQKLEPLEAQTDDLPKQAVKLQNALAAIKSIITANPQAAAPLQPVFDHLATLAAEQKQSQAEAEQAIKASQKVLNKCDTIDQATLALKAVPDMMSFLIKPLDFIASFAENVGKASLKSVLPDSAGKAVDTAVSVKNTAVSLAPGAHAASSASRSTLAKQEWELGSEEQVAAGIVARIPDSVKQTPVWKFIVSETQKQLPVLVNAPKNAQGVLKQVSAQVGDALAYANNQAFAAYCEKFEGNFKATMEAHFYTKPNAQGTITEWWSFGTAIAGKITLRYPKDAAGKAVALSGQIEGGATHFTYKEDVWNAEIFGKIAKGGIVRTKDVAPVAFDDASGGFVNSLTSPTSFFIPLTGQMVDGKIKFTMDAARTDFNLTLVKAHSFYVVIAPTTLMLPVLGHFDLPYMDAHFIMGHMFTADAEYPVTMAAKSMSIQSTFDKEFPANGNKATYTMDLKACNPGCAK